MKKDKDILELRKYFGKAKTKTTYEEERNIREEVGRKFAKFLIDCGIDSISLSPDAVIKTTLSVLEEEKKLRR